MIKGAHKLPVFSPPFVSMYNQHVIICTCIIFETIKRYVMLCYVMLCYVMLLLNKCHYAAENAALYYMEEEDVGSLCWHDAVVC